MARELFDQHLEARALLTQANDILGFRLTDILFGGTDEDLRRTDVTQPAIFVHSLAQFVARPGFRPASTAGHSLGEFSALVAAGVLTFEDALPLVARRAQAMQAACE